MNGDGVKDTFYHLGPLNTETTEDKKFFEDCISINEKGLLTIGSQPHIDMFSTDWEYENFITHHHQLSYVQFYIETNIGKKLYEKLNNDKRIFISYSNFETQEYIDNFISKAIVVTRIKEHIKKLKKIYGKYYGKLIPIDENGYLNTTRIHMDNNTQFCLDEYFIHNTPIIYTLLKNVSMFQIVCKESESAPAIVLEHINSL